MRVTVNPIRRVVTMLQEMQKKIIGEGETEAKLFDEYMCYCKTGGSTLQASIDEATTKIPQLESSIEGFGAENVQLVQDIDQAKKDRAESEATMAEATGIREKEAAAYAKEEASQKTDIAAMTKAVAALEKGMAGAFLQTPEAAVLSRVASSDDWEQSDRQAIASFLSAGQGDADSYAPSSGEILGIVKQMKDTMSKDLAEDIAAEEAAIKAYEGLMSAKTKEVKALSQSIETKTTRLGETGTGLVEMKEDLDDTKKALEEDTAFLKDFAINCANKQGEWDARSKLRAEELVALADTIKILNDDDALDLFKKALPSPSLLQLKVTSKEVMRSARQALARGKKHDARLNLIAMAMHGKKVNFDKIVGMIDEMVVLLKKEQGDDDSKKAYCQKELDAADDQKKALERTKSQLLTTIADGKEAVATLIEEIEALTAGIQALDKQVAEGTELRKEENTEYKKLMASNSAAKELLSIAKNRMNKFYNPKLYKAPPKQELSEEDRIAVNNGGTPPPTEKPGGIAGTGVAIPAAASFVQVSLHSSGSKAAPPPPPETFGAYTNKGEESNGVIGMIDLLVKDLDKEMTESETEEKTSQEDYEKFMADAAEKRSLDAKSLENKESAKAAAEESVLTAEQEDKATLKELMANAEYIGSLHAECDWLISNFEVRKQARSDEIDSLGRVKGVLSGADYSLVQTSSHSRLLRRRRA